MVFRGIKPILFIIIFTSLLNMFYTPGRVLWEWGFLRLTVEGIFAAVIMVVRLVFLIVGTSMLTYTTSPIVLTDGLERLLSPLKRVHFPAHELAMMMTIALRFIPTLVEETGKIMNAQKARGADFESGGLIHRARALIPILVPLFVSSFRRADELAVGDGVPPLPGRCGPHPDAGAENHPRRHTHHGGVPAVLRAGPGRASGGGAMTGNTALLLCYDGTAYHGWQTQKNGVSVQQTIERALEKSLGRRVRPVGRGADGRRRPRPAVCGQFFGAVRHSAGAAAPGAQQPPAHRHRHPGRRRRARWVRRPL